MWQVQKGKGRGERKVEKGPFFRFSLPPPSPSAPYLAIFEQGGSADIFSLITGGQR